MLCLIPLAGGLLTSCRDMETIRKALEMHNIPGATYVGSETCATCHDKEMKEFKLATHERISIPMEGVKVEGCEMCHGAGSLHVEAGGGKGVKIVNPSKDPTMCYACHMEKKAEFNLPHHHPVPEGHMSCTDCHNPHGPDARPWTSTSLEDTNELCFKCHKEQRGPFAIEHLALREGCTTCHKVHGSINDKMLSQRDASLCMRCHSDAALISDHAARLRQGTCFSGECHVAVHGSNYDKHLRY
ncbi:MAG: cytochrome c3 family protein [Candidatus Omnitrophota bacterium]